MLLSKFQWSILLALNFTATMCVLFPLQAKGHCLKEISVPTHPWHLPLTLGCLPVGYTKCTWDTNSLQSAQTTAISRTANSTVRSLSKNNPSTAFPTQYWNTTLKHEAKISSAPLQLSLGLPALIKLLSHRNTAGIQLINMLLSVSQTMAAALYKDSSLRQWHSSH